MKLVEILARELDEWPEGAAVITQDADGYKFCWNSNDVYFNIYWGVWGGSGCGEDTICDDAGHAIDGSSAIVTREMWEAERAKLNRAVEWDGSGFPPAGVDCEVEIYLDEWFKCTVVGNYEDRAVIVLANKETEHIANPDRLRPIRTPEQIAAEERERVLDDIYRIIRNAGRPGNKADMAEALYDAGYRKQEKDQ